MKPKINDHLKTRKEIFEKVYNFTTAGMRGGHEINGVGFVWVIPVGEICGSNNKNQKFTNYWEDNNHTILVETSNKPLNKEFLPKRYLWEIKRLPGNSYSIEHGYVVLDETKSTDFKRYWIKEK